MKRTFDEIYHEVVSFWPQKFSIRQREFHENGGVTMPELIAVHDAIEERICAIDDSYILRQMDWAVYTVVHGVLKKN